MGQVEEVGQDREVGTDGAKDGIGKEFKKAGGLAGEASIKGANERGGGGFMPFLLPSRGHPHRHDQTTTAAATLTVLPIIL